MSDKLCVLQDKHRYTRRKAKRIAKRFGQRIYKCRHCGSFHLTSQARDAEREGAEQMTEILTEDDI